MDGPWARVGYRGKTDGWVLTANKRGAMLTVADDQAAAESSWSDQVCQSGPCAKEPTQRACLRVRVRDCSRCPPPIVEVSTPMVCDTFEWNVAFLGGGYTCSLSTLLRRSEGGSVVLGTSFPTRREKLGGAQQCGMGSFCYGYEQVFVAAL